MHDTVKTGLLPTQAAFLAVVGCAFFRIVAPALGADQPLQVPPGYTIETAVQPPDVIFPMFACFDDAGRLFVAESSGGDLYDELVKQARRCQIRVLEDRDRDGIFETARVFAEKLAFPMGLVWRNGKLFVADPPDLITLEDVDNDGRAEKRTVLLTGFGHTDNGSLHGLTFGPDGLLYMTTGNPDGYHLKNADGSMLRGVSGALLRCHPDGSRPEVICRGFENLVEVVWTRSGEMIGTDNWFYQPHDGKRDALVHLVPGGLYPLHVRDQGTQHLFAGQLLPPVATFPAVAHSGLMRYVGVSFASDLRDRLISAQHNSRKIVAHQLFRDGSTFRSEETDLVTTEDPDFHPSDVLEDADGSILIVDTGSWYTHHCPTGRIRKSPAQGAIYRLRSGAKNTDDPRGAALNWVQSSPGDLAALLRDPRPEVRARASAELRNRGTSSIEPVAEILAGNHPLEVKQETLWVLATLPGGRPVQILLEAAQNDNPELAVSACRALASRDRPKAEAQVFLRAGVENPRLDLAPLLASPHVEVRLAAAEAIARIGTGADVPLLLPAVAQEPDAFLEHALINALHRLASHEDLRNALTHPSERVQRAALLLLDQAPRPGAELESVLKSVLAENDRLRTAAEWVFQRHPEWAPDAATFLEKKLSAGSDSSLRPDSLRGFLRVFGGNKEVIDVLARIVQSASAPAAARTVVLDAMSQIDRSTLPDEWRQAVRTCLEDGNDLVRAQALRTINVVQLAVGPAHLRHFAADPRNSREARSEAVRVLLRQEPRLDEPAFELLLQQLAPSTNPVARLAAAEALAAAEMTIEQFGTFLNHSVNDPVVSPNLALTAARHLPRHAEALPLLLGYLRERVREGWQIPEADLAWLRSSVSAADRDKLAALESATHEAARQQHQELDRLAPLLHDGDPRRGRELFFGKVACAACHRVGAEGGSIGPDLTKVGAVRAGRDLIESLVLPSATFAQGFDSYVLTTKAGAVHTGIRVKYTDDNIIVLRDPTGAAQRFRQEEVQQLERSAMSLMPEGLLTALSDEEIRDLLAFVQELK